MNTLATVIRYTIIIVGSEDKEHPDQLYM